MKKYLALFLAILMALTVFAGCTAAEEEPAGTNKFNLTTVKEGYLTVVTSPDYAPYEFYALNDEGKPELAGFDMYLAQYIADYLGLTLEVVPVDFNGILGEMAAGSADLAVAGLSPEPERAEKMDFSEIYYGGKQAFVTTTDKAEQFPDLASANKAGISVGAQSGTIQQELALQYSADAEQVTLVKATEIIAEVINGSLDGAYVEWDVAESYKKQYPNLHIVCEVPYENDGNIVGVAKGNEELLKYVNEAIKKCVDEGTFAQYLEKANALAAGEKYEGMLDEEGNIPTEGLG
ncbi:MAG: transporter substrate-binding domain-containing protein [Ruminococcaceae bacterium]|nr:transporter substrate-binding domain-containing protein [Oscillospiraceae bacterium]